MFSLHPQLEADTTPVCDLNLSRVLLMNNDELPWLILVPRRENISEWYELNEEDQQQLHKESMHLSATLMSLFNGDKLNIGSLGNIVPQLHIHHIVRYKSDSVWPDPVWGNIKASHYSDERKKKLILKIQSALIES